MSDDALERLKQRQRPSVPTRDASLVSSSSDIQISGHQETKVSTHLEIKTKQSTIRLEAELSERLSEVCKANGLSREVLIEALFEHYEADPQAWQAILELAKAKGEQRMQNANKKRARSMIQRFS
ncbi:hypothetical protein CLI64_29625 (plasmid) [Nostoc sp. CENA543]|uniref:ribbon-helix-helix protein, CopG family n=1 Tax=Nostoc sp. CENA543 TaxID=1869241 RepID=UPI000CA14BB9|nr:ribbon-helix-helix protein, CopG family [Nostoc sp. CENA543]AUT04601.1 hypothetical protein CLI64_29625 [Nostoc sp. CENA543]